MREHREWYSRGYLPHCDLPEKIQSVTIRLFDSMPIERRGEWEELLREEDNKRDKSGGHAASEGQRRRRIEEFLDAGYGACFVGKPEIAAMVEEALLHWDGQRYRVLAWVLMPNHAHLVFEMMEGWPLGDVMKRFKGFTSHEANRILGRAGQFWYPDYWDRYVRNVDHLENVIRYVHENPAKAGLVVKAEEWAWSSARFGGGRETTREVRPDGSF